MPNIGKWEVLNELSQALAMHAALLSTGQILYFGGNERIKSQHDAGQTGWDHTRIWTPNNGEVDYVPSPNHDLFCCGHCFLNSKLLLVIGGTQGWNDENTDHGHHGHMPGLRDVIRFDTQKSGLNNQIWGNNQLGVIIGSPWSDWHFFSNPDNKAKKIFIIPNADGRLHAFMIGLDNQIWHNDQTGVQLGSSWTGWNVLSHQGDKAKSLVVAPNRDGRLHAFMIGLDDQIWHNDQTGAQLGSSWTGWNVLSHQGDKAKKLVIVPNRDGRLHAFMIGLDDQIWHNDQTGRQLGSTWTGWNVLSHQGDKAKRLVVVTNKDGRLHAFMIGMDDQIWHNDQSGVQLGSSWTGWTLLSHQGDKAKSLIVAPNRDGRLHTFMIGMDDQIWHNDQTGVQLASSWTGWTFLSKQGDKAKNLVVVPNRDGRLHTFMIGMDDQIWHNDQSGVQLGSSWTGWNLLSHQGDKAKSLVVVSDMNGQLHAFAIGISRFPWINAALMLPQPVRSFPNPSGDGGGGRWYPTPITLSNGSVCVMGGHPNRDDTRHSNFLVEVYDSITNQWLDKGDEPVSVISAVQNRPDSKPEIYPRLHLLSNGTVFCVLLADEKSYIWDPMNGFSQMPSSVITPLEIYLSNGYDTNLWGSVLLPLRPSLLYNPRIMVAGGAVQAYHINPLDPNSHWQPTNPRQNTPGVNHPPIRNFASLVLLPDGTVLMVGGTQDWTDDKNAVLVAEQYDPITDSWTRLAEATVPRQYHSTALLLPDGRVWTGGSNPMPGNGTIREERMEVFSPPYLFRGDRPIIQSVPENISYAVNFSIICFNPDRIKSATLMRCGSSTHGFDADQRFVEIEITNRSVAANTLTLKSPPNNNIAPPGAYMLFVLNFNDVPCHAHIIQI